MSADCICLFHDLFLLDDTYVLTTLYDDGRDDLCFISQGVNYESFSCWTLLHVQTQMGLYHYPRQQDDKESIILNSTRAHRTPFQKLSIVLESDLYHFCRFHMDACVTGVQRHCWHRRVVYVSTTINQAPGEHVRASRTAT